MRNSLILAILIGMIFAITPVEAQRYGYGQRNYGYGSRYARYTTGYGYSRPPVILEVPDYRVYPSYPASYPVYPPSIVIGGRAPSTPESEQQKERRKTFESCMKRAKTSTERNGCMQILGINQQSAQRATTATTARTYAPAPAAQSQLGPADANGWRKFNPPPAQEQAANVAPPPTPRGFATRPEPRELPAGQVTVRVETPYSGSKIRTCIGHSCQVLKEGTAELLVTQQQLEQNSGRVSLVHSGSGGPPCTFDARPSDNGTYSVSLTRDEINSCFPSVRQEK